MLKPCPRCGVECLVHLTPEQCIRDLKEKLAEEKTLVRILEKQVQRLKDRPYPSLDDHNE